jgi:hypothetical protein
MLRGPVQDFDGIALASSAICRAALLDLNKVRLRWRESWSDDRTLGSDMLQSIGIKPLASAMKDQLSSASYL